MPSEIIHKNIEVNVLFDTVRIEIHCGDDYAAQVVFDDIVDKLQSPGGLLIRGRVKEAGVKG